MRRGCERSCSLRCLLQPGATQSSGWDLEDWGAPRFELLHAARRRLTQLNGASWPPTTVGVGLTASKGDGRGKESMSTAKLAAANGDRLLVGTGEGGTSSEVWVCTSGWPQRYRTLRTLTVSSPVTLIVP